MLGELPAWRTEGNPFFNQEIAWEVWWFDPSQARQEVKQCPKSEQNPIQPG